MQRLDPSVDKRPLSPRVPRETSTHKPGTRQNTIQLLLKLPGFAFTSDTNVFSAGRSTRFAYLLGAQSAPAYSERVAIASNQGIVSVRVADILEVCCDEWLEWWQDEPLLKNFWDEAAESLRCHNRYWASREPTVTGEEVCMISQAYTGRWDENGRGRAISGEAIWGFELGGLTWGKTKAKIDPDLFAKPWEYERACKLPCPSSLNVDVADEKNSTENAARDFLEYITESAATFGPIEAAERVRNTGRNRSATRNGNGRSLVAHNTAPMDSRSRTTNMDKTHQLVLGGDNEMGEIVVVPGPRHRSNEQSQGSFSVRARATVGRSDPNRLLVTFSGFLDKIQEEQEAPHGDEGKDFRPQVGAGEDVEMS